MNEQKDSSDSDILKDYIYQRWRTEYLSSHDCTSLFFKTYEERYNRLLTDTRIHRDKNFQGKDLYRYVLYAFAVIQVLLLSIAVYLSVGQIIKNVIEIATFSEAMLLAITSTILLSIAKYLDVQKYQETWARTRQSLHECRTEMIRYVEKLTPYSNHDADIRFQKRILEILDRNRAKFTQNLEEKEKGLLDELSILKR